MSNVLLKRGERDVFFKNVRIIRERERERLWKCFQIKENFNQIKGKWQLSAVSDPSVNPDLEVGKGISGLIDKIDKW